MKTTKSPYDTLKGVMISLLTPKGQMAKNLSEALSKLGCQVHQESDLQSLIDTCQGSPAKAFILEAGYCEEYDQKRREKPSELENVGSDAVVIVAKEGQTEEASKWAHQLNAFLISTPIRQDELGVLLERALDTTLLQNRLRRYESPEESIERFGSIVAKSMEMKDTIRVARILAQRDDHLLFIGGVGSGKELLARTIHENSTRRHGPFYSINCRSFSNEDLATEIFGKGDPDGEGMERAPGDQSLLELCEGGSLMMDDIGEISPNVQGKLQRFVEDKTYTRVNSRKVCKADVRIFAATTEPLNEAVAKGEFSEDLYFYLNRFTLHLPALKRRTEDIPILTRELLKKIAAEKGEDEGYTITEDALKLMVEYNWPGNVRELENVMEYATLVATENEIKPHHLPKQFHDEVGSIFVGSTAEELPPMSEIERQYILRVMDAVKGNKVKAANILDVNRATLHRKLQIYEANKKAGKEF